MDWSLDIYGSILLTTNFSWWYLCTYDSVVTSVTTLYNSYHYENIQYIIIILDLWEVAEATTFFKALVDHQMNLVVNERGILYYRD